MFGKVGGSLRTFSLLKNLPVIENDTGETIGQVIDILFNNKGMIAGILMNCKGFFQRDRIIPFQSITAIGNDGVLIDRLENLQPLQKDDSMFCLESRYGLIGKMVFSTEGEKLGILQDVYFLENLGTIVGYELTEGFFAELTEGKKLIQTNQAFSVGKELMIVQVSNVNERCAHC
jgi:uncharacterized protein YrrD